MTKSGVGRSLSTGLAVFFTLAVSFSSRVALAVASLWRFEIHESLAVTITINFIGSQDKDYPQTIV